MFLNAGSGGIDIIEVKLTFEMLAVRGQQHLSRARIQQLSKAVLSHLLSLSIVSDTGDEYFLANMRTRAAFYFFIICEMQLLIHSRTSTGVCLLVYAGINPFS